MSTKIAKITLENFKQFVGKHELELSTDSKKNITIIQGNNASGKTNLVSAISWCFYDYSVIRDVCCNPESIASNQLKRRGNEGKHFTTSVELILIYKGKKYRIKRQLEYTINKRKPKGLRSAFSLYQLEPDGEKPLAGIMTLDSLIPQDAAVYFFLVWTRTFSFGLNPTKTQVQAAMASLLGSEYVRQIPAAVKECNRLFKAIADEDRYSSSKIQFSKEHRLSLQDKKGNNILPMLPVEPLAALGLAFFLSLIKQSKYEFPVMLDSPFLWFTNYQKNVANSLKELKRQVILFASDAELYNMKSVLRDKIGKYQILSLNKKNVATVVTLKN